MFTKEDVEILAYQRYTSGEDYDISVWYFAELVVTILKNVKNGYDIKPVSYTHLTLPTNREV